MKANLPTLAALAWGMAALVEAKSPSSSTETTSSTRTVPTWKGATTYPTVVTRSWSRTLTSKPARTEPVKAAEATSPFSSAASPSTTSIAIQTVTLYEPWPSSPEPEFYPYTLMQTAITTRQEYEVHVGDGGKTTTSTLSMAPTAATRTVTSTWLIWDTSPTDLPAGSPVPPCEGGCAPPIFKEDKRCLDKGLVTACHSQCKIRHIEGWDVWWCHKRTGNDTAETGLGRVCTDSAKYYEQLLEPCDHSDHRVDCPPCADDGSMSMGSIR